MFLRSALKLGKGLRRPMQPPETIFEERSLSHDENELLRFLLSHTDADAAAFLSQLAQTTVIGRCGWGCPTIDLTGPDRVEEFIHKPGPIVHAVGKTADGRQVGVLVWSTRRQLSGLEIYNLSESDEPWGLPTIESLTAFSGEPLRAVSFNA